MKYFWINIEKWFEWFVLFVVLLILLFIGGLRTPGQTMTMPYPVTIPYPIISPGAGVMGGLVYAVTQAPQHTRPDNRRWTESQGNHRLEIRSWTLSLFQSRGAPAPYMSKHGFCTRAAAIAHAVRNHPTLYHVETPSPLPAWRCDGYGAWGKP